MTMRLPYGAPQSMGLMIQAPCPSAYALSREGWNRFGPFKRGNGKKDDKKELHKPQRRSAGPEKWWRRLYRNPGRADLACTQHDRGHACHTFKASRPGGSWAETALQAE